MSEGAAKTEKPATAEEAFGLGAIVETVRQRGEARFSDDLIEKAKSEIDAARVMAADRYGGAS